MIPHTRTDSEFVFLHNHHKPAWLPSKSVSASVADLVRKMRRYINAYSKDAKPFRWKYFSSKRSVRHAKSIFATVH